MSSIEPEGERKGERKGEREGKKERGRDKEIGREKGGRLTILCRFTCSSKVHLKVGRLYELTGTVFCSWIGGWQLKERHIRVEPSVEWSGVRCILYLSQKDYTHFMYFIAVNMYFVTFEGGARHIHKDKITHKNWRWKW